jgi:hypothetical protein
MTGIILLKQWMALWQAIYIDEKKKEPESDFLIDA